MKLRALVFCFLLPSLALADALPPPSTPAAQIAAAPNHRPLILNSADGSSFRYTGGDTAHVTRPAGHYGTVSPGSGGTLTGNKTHPIRLTNNYGQVATGQIRTATTYPTDTYTKAGALLMGAQVIGSATQHQGVNIGQAIAAGDYQTAGQRAVEGLLQGLRTAGDTVLMGGISGVSQGYQAYINADPKNAAEAAMKAQAQKAQDAAARYEALKAAQDYHDVLPQANGQPQRYPRILHVLSGPAAGYYLFPSDFNGSSGGTYYGGIRISLGNGKFFTVGNQPCYGGCDPSTKGNYTTIATNPGNYQQYLPAIHQAISAGQPQPTVQDFLLTQAELAQSIEQYLQQSLAQNAAQHTQLLNALVGGGHLDPSKQPTQVLGTPAENTFLTAPFTPAGGNQAQQTQFVVNPDGSVTVSTINRPDLAAHTSQAPTRAEVGQTATAPDTIPAKPSATAEAPDVCANNPNSLMCADMGSGDYTDPVIPTKSIPLDFKPADIFSTDGVCPAPVAIEVMGVTKQWTWEPTCDGARKIRPIAIASVIIMCGMFVFGAIREL